MRKNIVDYFRSLSAGTIGYMTGETAYAKIDAIHAEAINFLQNAPESVLEGLSEGGEHAYWIRWDKVADVLKAAKNRLYGA